MKTDGNSERAGPPLAFSVPVLMDSSRDVRTLTRSHTHGLRNRSAVGTQNDAAVVTMATKKQ